MIVAISTEGPEFSSRRYEDVLKPLHDAGAAFHAIVLGLPSNDISERRAEPRRGARRRPADQRRPPHRRCWPPRRLPGELKRLAAELTHQYRITYARPLSLIPPEHVTVSATRPGLTARGTLITERPTKKGSRERIAPVPVGGHRRGRGRVARDQQRRAGAASRGTAPAAPPQAARPPDPGVPRRRRAGVAQRDGGRRQRRATSPISSRKTSTSSKTA